MKTPNWTPWIIFLLAIGLNACVGSDASDELHAKAFVQKDDDVCDPSDDDYDPTDPRCLVNGPGGSGVLAPANCAGNDPTCNRAQNYPSQVELTTANSQNVFYSTAANGLELFGGSGAIVDSDGDFVPDPADECVGPGWRLPCDGDASDDGLYQTLFFDSGGDVTLGADINVSASLQKADAYLLMDATGSMGGEQAQLIATLTSGTFLDPVECPEAADSGLLGALKCVVPEIWLGLGQFNEVPLLPHGNPFDHAPYHHHLDMTDNLQHIIDAVSALTIAGNKDLPEAGSQALYSIMTGQGLGPWVPNRAGCPAGRWGYPCFRPGILPIVIIFSDAGMHNGPLPSSSTYDPATFAAGGLGTRLPPVEQDPGMIYSDGPLTAHNLGDLTAKSVSVMGTNVNFNDSFTTWTFGACNYCPGSGCWGDGKDGAVFFSLSAPTSTFVSSIGTFPDLTNMALADSGLNYLACDHGPGGGDWWGRTTQVLGAGDWYAINDPGVSPSSSVNSELGPFQIRIQTTPDDPSWQTRDMPIPWTDVETELLAANAKIVSIVSPNSGGLIGLADLTELGLVTNSVDQSGQPYLETIAGDGQGLGTALLDAVRALVGDTRRDVTVIAEDNPASPIDERNFLSGVTATQCPTTGIANCLGGLGTDTCEGCLADTTVSFQFRIGNNFVLPGPTPQVFEFDLVALADGITELNRIPVRVMVPPAGALFGTGFYQVTYDSDVVCEMPPERPDWGFLTWSGTTPSNSTIEFEVFTANSVSDLDTVIPVSIQIPSGSTGDSYDVGPLLVGNGRLNYLPYLRVRAKLEGSSDGTATPTLSGWTMQFNCVPFD